MNEVGLGYPHKIVTCCYCGTRAALVLKGKSRHELTWSSCGAPLHELKMLPMERGGRRELVDRPRAKPAKPSGSVRKDTVRRKRKRKGLLKKVFEEAFDFLEDVLD